MLQNSHAAIPPLSEVRWCATLEPIYDPVVADNESCYPGGSVWSGNCQRLVSSKPKRRSWPSIGCAYRQCVRRRKWVWTPRGLSRNSSNACCYAGELESPEVCIFHLYSSFDRWINYSITGMILFRFLPVFRFFFHRKRSFLRSMQIRWDLKMRLWGGG